MADCCRKYVRILVALILVALLAGCLPPTRQVDRSLRSFSRDPMQIARLNCFLALEAADVTPVQMEISRLEILSGDTWLPILRQPQQFDSVAIGGGQRFVGALSLAPGNYRKIRVEVTRAQVQSSDGSVYEALSEPRWFTVPLGRPVSTAVDDSKTLLLSWDVEGSLGKARSFAPLIRGRQTAPQIWSDLVFVSCPEIDTIFVIRADNNRVVTSFGLRGAPTYMALDPDRANRRMYVLCSRERMIKLIDLETYRVSEFFAVPLTDDPSDMEISPDGRSLYLLDERSGYLTRMDSSTGQILARAFLDFRPSFLSYLPDQNQLAVSQSLAQKVLLLDPLSLKVTGSFPTGNSPAGLLETDRQLFIAERGENMVRVIDLRNNRELNRFTVGMAPKRLQSIAQQLYVSNSREGSLSVLQAGGFGVTQTIHGLGTPGELAMNLFYRRLYVTDVKGDLVNVVDVNSNRVIGHVPLGALPFDLEMIE